MDHTNVDSVSPLEIQLRFNRFNRKPVPKVISDRRREWHCRRHQRFHISRFHLPSSLSLHPSFHPALVILRDNVVFCTKAFMVKVLRIPGL